MRKIFVGITAMLFVMQSCKDIDYAVDPAYEKAEITGVELYSDKLVRADQISTINSEAGTVIVMLRAGQDITRLKLAITASAGTSVFPVISVGLQDFSTAKTYTLTSPNKTIEKDWTITVQNP